MFRIGKRKAKESKHTNRNSHSQVRQEGAKVRIARKILGKDPAAACSVFSAIRKFPPR